MSGLFDEPDDATPLTIEERDGLIPAYITDRAELNAAEERNIIAADQWAFSRRRSRFDEPLLRSLHRRMFGKVWRWAGKYRTTERNLGIPAWQIETEVHQAMRDLAYRIEYRPYSPDEIAVRFHHTLVVIHPFVNGNGRCARLAADIVAVRLGQRRLTWGSSSLRASDDVRKAYIDALRKADGHDMVPLLSFARS